MITIESTNNFFFLLFTVFRDLLAAIATTERQMYRITLQDDADISQLQELLLTRLSFDSISTSLNIEDVN